MRPKKPRRTRKRTIKLIPYPPTSENMRSSPEVRKAVSELINSPVFIQIYSVLVSERPSRQIQITRLAPHILASLQSFSQGYEACLNKLLNLAEAPPEAAEEPMTFGVDPS